ncbi:MAG TPA: sigma-70 family RNA polymerase sigma factor [Gemmatimonadota bacterium]|jgi:RNA polymerase sigma-70 factor (ECF subfamily)
MPDDDAQLVERSRAGDRDAFGALVRRHLPAAHAVALAVTGESADADDVCQDAFVAALAKLDECRNPDRFGAWLRQIVRNRARDLQRVRAARPQVRLEAAADAAGPDDPSAAVERRESAERLRAALATLREVGREVVLLHDLEGLRHREIADLLGLSEGAVRVQLFRARRALRARLQADAAAGAGR